MKKGPMVRPVLRLAILVGRGDPSGARVMEVYCVALYLTYTTVAHGHVDLMDGTLPWNRIDTASCEAPFLKLTSAEWVDLPDGLYARRVDECVELQRGCDGTTMIVAQSGPFDDFPPGSLKVVGLRKSFKDMAVVPMHPCHVKASPVDAP